MIGKNLVRMEETRSIKVYKKKDISEDKNLNGATNLQTRKLSERKIVWRLCCIIVLKL